MGTKVSEAELRVLESRAERAGLTLSEWVRDVLLGSSVEMGTLAAERAILAEVLAMRTIVLNFMLKVGEGNPIPGAAGSRVFTPTEMWGLLWGPWIENGINRHQFSGRQDWPMLLTTERDESQ